MRKGSEKRKWEKKVKKVRKENEKWENKLGNQIEKTKWQNSARKVKKVWKENEKKSEKAKW